MSASGRCWRTAAPHACIRPRTVAGQTLDEIAKALKTTLEDAATQLLPAGAIFFMMSEDEVKLALRQPWVSVGTDHPEVSPTGPLSEGKAHPRGYGSFARILGSAP